MKIYTDNVDFEMTIEEFENILERGLLDATITIIATLSERAGESIRKRDSEDDDELTCVINNLIEESLDDDDNDDYDDEDEEDENTAEDNEAVRRIYSTIFGNGERRP